MANIYKSNYTGAQIDEAIGKVATNEKEITNIKTGYIPIKDFATGPFQIPQIGYNKELNWIDCNTSISAQSIVQRDGNGIIYINPPDTVPENINEYAGVNVGYANKTYVKAINVTENTYVYAASSEGPNGRLRVSPTVEAGIVVQTTADATVRTNDPKNVYDAVNLQYLNKKAALLAADNTFTGTNIFTGLSTTFQDSVDFKSSVTVDGSLIANNSEVILSSGGTEQTKLNYANILKITADGNMLYFNYPTDKAEGNYIIATTADLLNIYTTANSEVPQYKYGQVKTEQGLVTIGASVDGCDSTITVGNTIKLNAFGDTYIQLSQYELSLNGTVSLDHHNPDRPDQMTISMPIVIDGNHNLKISDESVSGNYVSFSASGEVTIKRDGTTTIKSLKDIGSGSGDVTAAGNNIFTGSNAFKQILSIYGLTTSGMSTNGLLFQTNQGSTYCFYLGNRWITSTGNLIKLPTAAGTLALTSDIKIKSASLDGTTLTLTI